MPENQAFLLFLFFFFGSYLLFIGVFIAFYRVIPKLQLLFKNHLFQNSGVKSTITV